MYILRVCLSNCAVFTLSSRCRILVLQQSRIHADTAGLSRLHSLCSLRRVVFFFFLMWLSGLCFVLARASLFSLSLSLSLSLLCTDRTHTQRHLYLLQLVMSRDVDVGVNLRVVEAGSIVTGAVAFRVLVELVWLVCGNSTHSARPCSCGAAVSCLAHLLLVCFTLFACSFPLLLTAGACASSLRRVSRVRRSELADCVASAAGRHNHVGQYDTGAHVPHCCRHRHLHHDDGDDD